MPPKSLRGSKNRNNNGDKNNRKTGVLCSSAGSSANNNNNHHHHHHHHHISNNSHHNIGKPNHQQQQNQTSSSETNGASASVSCTTDTEMKFQEEIAWCLDRLEKTIQSSKGKDEKKRLEALKAWKILNSKKSALVQKRQVMRLSFGDYRAAMEQEEEEYKTRLEQLQLTPATAHKKSTYLKSSSSTGITPTVKDFQSSFSISEPEKNVEGHNPQLLADSSLSINTLDTSSVETKPFKFNFIVNT